MIRWEFKIFIKYKIILLRLQDTKGKRDTSLKIFLLIQRQFKIHWKNTSLLRKLCLDDC